MISFGTTCRDLHAIYIYKHPKSCYDGIHLSIRPFFEPENSNRFEHIKTLYIAHDLPQFQDIWHSTWQNLESLHLADKIW